MYYIYKCHEKRAFLSSADNEKTTAQTFAGETSKV